MSDLVADFTAQGRQPWRLGLACSAGRLTQAAVCLAFMVTVALALGASPRRTGDAHQYIAMAQQLARLQPPSLSRSDETAYRFWLMAHDSTSGFPDSARAVRQPALVREDRQEFSHFWVYSLLTAPATAIAGGIGLHPLTAFTLTNAALLGVALWAAAQSFGSTTALVVLASPLIWFVGRAQVEIFTFALLCLAMAAAATGRWGWASLAVAAAATQNVPIAAAIPLVWLVAVVNWVISRKAARLPPVPDRRQTMRAVAFATIAVGMSLLHPIYYLSRLGVFTPQQLNGGIAAGTPSLTRYLAPLIDPDIGFLAWLPAQALLAFAGAFILARTVRRSTATSMRLALSAICGLAMGMWFLFVFAQTTNVNSGGTVHVSRYALWLLPLTLPAISATIGVVDWRAPGVMLVASMVLFAANMTFFHPDQPERYVEHSAQATWLMTHAPAVYRPLPEVFVERTLHIDGGPRVSAADPTCRIVFLLAAQPDQPCPLSATEQATAAARFSAGDDAVWVRRGAHGDSAITTALPER